MSVEGAAGESRTAIVRDVVLRDERIVRVRLWPGEATPFVLLHGLLDSSEGWSEFARETHRTCIAFDLPGFGASSRPSRPSLAAYAADVLEVLGRLGVESCVMVGHSLGGAIAAAVADEAPERVAALGLLAPAGFGRIHLAELVSIPGVRNLVNAGLPLALRSRAAVTAAYMTVVTSGRRPTGGIVDRVSGRAREMVPGARDATEAIVVAGGAPDGFARRVLGYDGPAHVLWGSQDRLVPISHLAALRRALPQAYVETGRFGHHPHRECRARLWRFMDDVYAAASGGATVSHLPRRRETARRRGAVPLVPAAAGASR